MLNTIEILEGLSEKEWSALFERAEKAEQKAVQSRNADLLYRYLGEIDCPEEMLQDFATMEDIRRCGGKTNWFVCSDGTFFTCGDCAVDSLFESGKVVDYKFPFEIERDKRYFSLSKDERISFRVNLQEISETTAKEIVCSEMGIPAYKNIYLFSVIETHFDSFDKSEETKEYKSRIEADTEEEAREKLVLDFREVGSIITSGKRFTKEDNIKMREPGKLFGYKGGTPFTITLKDRKFSLLEVKENHGYWD